MLKYYWFVFVHDVLGLSDGHIKLFCQWLIADAVNISPLEDAPVSVTVDMLVYHRYDMAVCVLHHFFFMI